MITASTSSTLTAEAIPAPSAATARSIDLGRELVAVLERARPDAARQARALVLLHQLEQVGLAALLLVQLAHVRFHRRAARRRPPCSRAARTCSARRRSRRPRARSRRRAPRPVHGLPSRISPPPTPVPQNTPSSESYGAPGAELELGVGRDLHVVADARPCSRAHLRACPPAGSEPSQPGRLRALVTLPPSIVPGEPTPTPASAAGSTLASAPALAQRRAISAATSAGPPLVGVGRRAEPSTLVIVVEDRRLDLRAAEVDPAVVGHRR